MLAVRGGSHHTDLVIVQMLDLGLRHVNLDSSQCVHRLGQALESHRDIVRDIQIRVHVDHSQRLLWTSEGIGAVTLFVRVVPYI